MATKETDATVKATFAAQASAYRRLAAERAHRLNLTLPPRLKNPDSDKRAD